MNPPKGGFFLPILSPNMTEQNQYHIESTAIVDPFVSKNGEVAYFVAQPHGTKQEWARNSGLETINGGLEWATSGAEDYFDEVTQVRGVMDYDLFGLGIPYHLHVALNKAEGGQHWWNQTKAEGYGGKIFAAGDVTMTLRDSYGHHILNKPDTPDHQEEI